MIRTFYFILIALLVLSLLLGCTSKFDKAQREKQEEFTQFISEKVLSSFSTITTSLIERIQNPSAVDYQNFRVLSQQFPEIFGILLYNNSLELQRKYPSTLMTGDLLENCLSFHKRKNVSSIRKPFIGHSVHEIDNKVFLCIVIPLSSENQEVEEIVVVLVNTYVFFNRIEQQYIDYYPYSLIVVNEKQDVVFDSDPSRIGKDFLTETDSDDYDPVIKDLYNIMNENATDFFIVKSYENTKIIKKLYTWHTVQSYGETFYINLVRTLYRNTGKDSKEVYLLSMLRSFALQDTLIDPIIDNKPEELITLLKYIYENNQNVYSVQLADTSGTIILGWPPSNSVVGYSISKKKNKPFDDAFRQVLQTKQESIVETPLLEGGFGKIIFIPILVYDDFYGVLMGIEPEGGIF